MSRAISATIGAAPVPVPPPIPAVINTMSLPRRTAAIASRLSSPDFCPISGLEPAPFPWVILSPIWIFCIALERNRACLSVLTVINSTPCTPETTMRSTALPPPPPTPITFICTMLSSLSISKGICCILLSFYIKRIIITLKSKNSPFIRAEIQSDTRLLPVPICYLI